MSKALSETEKMTLNIYNGLSNLFVDEEDQDPVQKTDIEGIEANDLFTAILLGYKMLFEQLTSSDADLIDFTHILNKLAIQYVLENKSNNKSEEE